MRSQSPRRAHDIQAVFFVILLRLARRLEGHAARHPNVSHDQRVQATAKPFESFGGVRRGLDLPPPAQETGFERGSHAAVIIDHENSVHSVTAPSIASLSVSSALDNSASVC